MVSSNRALRAGGLALVVIAFALMAYFVQYSKQSAIGIAQQINTVNSTAANVTKLTQIASSEHPGTSIVTIPLGAGVEGRVLEYFVPANLTINTGDTVTWVDHDTVAHTITAAAFNSVVYPAGSAIGNNSFSHVISNPGVYAYFCQIHPWMSGTINAIGKGKLPATTITAAQNVTTTTSNNVQVIMVHGAPYIPQNGHGVYYIPENAQVPSGATVTFTDKDFVAHTATASDGKAFDTGPVLPGKSITIHVNGIGKVAYYCEFHPWMQGSLTMLSSRNK
jgi:plastocyanin